MTRHDLAAAKPLDHPEATAGGRQSTVDAAATTGSAGPASYGARPSVTAADRPPVGRVMVESAAEALAGPDLVTCSQPYWAAYLRGYTDACAVGYEQHRAEVEATDDAMWVACSRSVRARANSPTFAELCDRRGEPERAERARAHCRRLGLAS